MYSSTRITTGSWSREEGAGRETVAVVALVAEVAVDHLEPVVHEGVHGGEGDDAITEVEGERQTHFNRGSLQFTNFRQLWMR